MESDRRIMGMLDRYKKKGGFLQLLQLIETSGKAKQEQFLSLIAQESPVWEDQIRKKILTLDKILTWNSVYLSEIFSRIQPLTLASAFHGLPEDKVSAVLKAISTTDLRKFQMTLQEINPNAAEKATSQMKILSETRALISQGLIKLDRIDSELIVPENIEEKLADGSLNVVSNGTVKSPSHVPERTSNQEHKSYSSGKLDGKSDVKPEAKVENSTAPKSDSREEAKADAAREEIDFLRKKVNQLVNENNLLKHELSVLKNKIDQIKKIA